LGTAGGAGHEVLAVADRREGRSDVANVDRLTANLLLTPCPRTRATTHEPASREHQSDDRAFPSGYQVARRVYETRNVSSRRLCIPNIAT